MPQPNRLRPKISLISETERINQMQNLLKKINYKIKAK